MVGPRALGLFKPPNQTEPRLLGRSPKAHGALCRTGDWQVCTDGNGSGATSDHVIGLERPVYGPRWRMRDD